MASAGQHSRLAVHVVDAAGRPVRAPGLGVWLSGVAPASARGEVTIALVSDTRIRALNRQYRGKDASTDVLSFPTVRPSTRSGRTDLSRAVRPEPVEGRTTPHLGDIVIARGVARRQAREAGHAETTEWRLLALHGFLHLLGYDHETDNGRMARAETRLRQKGGLKTGLIERGHRQ
jgi:probable rRNA maturation factor